MEARRLGRTGATVSALGFGGAPAGLSGYLGDWDAREAAAQREVERAIRRALDLGVTYFDTAPGYGGGLSEVVFGRGLAGARDHVFLATKTPRDRFGDPAGIRASLEESLRLLGTDHVDLLQFHGGWWSDADAAAVLERGLETYERLRDEGKTRFLGFTAEGPNGAVERLIATGRFDTVMMCFNLTYQGAGAYRNRVQPPETALSLAKQQGMGVVTMRTLTSGVFQRWLREIGAPDFDWNAALLGFVLSHPQVDVALVGMRTAEEVEQNVRVVEERRFHVDMEIVHDGYGR